MNVTKPQGIPVIQTKHWELQSKNWILPIVNEQAVLPQILR